MIYSAMIFALGVFVSGLLWLGLTVALVGRAKRLTARRILANVATRRAEFETERDALRAKHAVEMHRVEREVDRVLDMATAYRLESDVKERDVASMRAELEAREEEAHEMQQRLAAERELLQDLERRHAEAGATLRAVQHALSLEVKRRAMADEAADAASMIAEQQRAELGALRAEAEALRAILSERLPADDLDAIRITADRPDPFAALSPPGGSVVPLHARPRVSTAMAAPPEPSATPPTDVESEVQELAGETHADFGRGAWRAAAAIEPRMPVVNAPAEPADLEKRRAAQANTDLAIATPSPTRAQDAETRFFEALAEIRALKRAANQAGE
jgi:hypothetical protein